MHRTDRVLFAAILAALAPFSLGAQMSPHPLKHGTWILGGTAGVSSSRDIDGGDRLTTIQILPIALYFVTPRMALGGSAGLLYATSGDGHATTLQIGPSLRYYFAVAPARMLPHIGLTLLAGRTRFGSDLGGTQTITNFGGDAAFGLTYLLVPHVGLGGEAYYQRTHLRFHDDVFEDSNDTDDFGLRFGFSAFVFH